MQSSEAAAEQGQGPRVEVVRTEEVPYLAEVRAALELGHQARREMEGRGVAIAWAAEPRA